MVEVDSFEPYLVERQLDKIMFGSKEDEEVFLLD